MRRPFALPLVALATTLLLGVSASAFSFYDTGVSGGDPTSSLLGVTVTSADVGSSFDIDWDATLSGNALSASATFEIIALSSTSLTLGVSITNTTLLTSTLTNADILSMGFGVTPNVTSSFSTTGSVFDAQGVGAGPNQNFPGGFSGIDVCVFGQNCAGGAVAQGLHAGASDSFTLSVAGNFSGGSLDLLYFPLKFQTNLGSLEPGGALIPEPSSALLFGVGVLLARGHVRRRGLQG